MKKNFSSLIYPFILFPVMLLFNGCVKDNCQSSYTYSYYTPIYNTRAEVKAGIKSSAPQDIENPGKIVLLGKYIFLNEIDKGIHIIDNVNPASPKNVAFIHIPGNVDLALKGNTMYADLYTDLVTLDISHPLQVTVKKYNEGVFPDRNYSYIPNGDSSKIITDWIKKDTTITIKCGDGAMTNGAGPVYFGFSSVSSPGSNKSSSSPIGQGGSMARFAIVDNNMYTVSQSELNVFNISTPFDPVYKTKINVGISNVETIFPFKDKLLVGSQNGMFVYVIQNPEKPILIGKFAHVQSCDPVIVDEKYAYVTLRSGSACQGFTNQLEILQLTSFTNPWLIKTYPFTNPHGLSKDGNLLFICDGNAGLKVLDATDVSQLKLMKQFKISETYDVIAHDHIALVVAKDGLYQYDYSDPKNIHLISKVSIKNSKG